MIDSEKITVVLTLATDFHATVQAITDAHREQQVILEAVRGRIFAEKQRAEARQMELQAIIADSSRNVTVRNLSQREFESLSSAKEGATTITFDDLKTALADQKTGSDLDCSTTPKRKTRRKVPPDKKTSWGKRETV